MTELDFSKADGLVPAIVQQNQTGEVLMLAYMNLEAWRKTLESGQAYYWSRSRKEIWHKGATSGNIQKICSIHIDCDKDTVLLKVDQIGGVACHTGKKSCFFTEVDISTGSFAKT